MQHPPVGFQSTYRRLPAALRSLARYGAHRLPVSDNKVSFDLKARRFTAGADLPPRGTVAWVGKGGDPVTARLMDMAAMFDGSAAALTRMFEDGQWPLPPEAVIRMSEASALLVP